ncbi:hypothetical protein [Adhaeribacter soli]|uniref:hypothetical protein n=1 Tax=Adhaeribacter soli TaxID=2607655 RepID=UPI001782A322|nr:hypothetical protein [Adhaeribacter soli]
MIELVIAAMIQVATLSADATAMPAQETTDATITSTAATAPVTTTPGGTGSWDDNN